MTILINFSLFVQCEYTYMLSVVVADGNGQLWCTMFGDVAQELLKISANDLHLIKQRGDHERYDQIFDKAIYGEFCIKFSVRNEFYQDEQKVRCNVVAISPMNYVHEITQLLSAIQSYNL